MRELEAMVELTLKRKFLLKLEENESPGEKVIKMIHGMSAEECKQILTTGFFNIDIDEFSKEKVVTKVIKEFDPIYDLSNEGNQVNNYGAESRKIANRLKQDMSDREIAAIIAEEVNRIHYLDLSSEYFSMPAKEIHYYFNEAVIEKEINNRTG